MAGAKLMKPQLDAAYINASSKISCFTSFGDCDSGSASHVSSGSESTGTNTSNNPPTTEVAVFQVPVAVIRAIIAATASEGVKLTAKQIAKLSKSAKELDRNGLTKAGRALQKHGNREGSKFPKPGNKATEKNEQGQKILDDILNSKNQTIKQNNSPYNGVDIRDNVTGRGARYNDKGEFVGFLD